MCREAATAVKAGVSDSQSLLYGPGRSVLKGIGYEYVDFRPYSWGDDVRHVDWRLSARLIRERGEMQLVVKEYMSERRVELFIALDLSASMHYWDKLRIAYYATALFLETARKLEDRVYFAILSGGNALIAPYREPLEILHYLVHVVCREVEPGTGDSLEGLITVLPRFKGVRGVLVVTDYAHHPLNYYRLGSTARSMDSSLGIVIATSRYEISPPVEEAYVALRSPSNKLAIGGLGDLYREIQNHVKECRAYIKVAARNSLEIYSLKAARENKLRIVKTYLALRQRFEYTRV